MEEEQPEGSATSPPPPPPVPRAVKGATLPQEWKDRMRKPRSQSSQPLPGESAADKGLDMTGFTKMYKDLKKVKITDELKDAYCDRLLVHGKKTIAAIEVGLHYNTVREHAKIDPGFQEAIAEALAARSQRIVDGLEESALNGEVSLGYDKEGNLISEKVVFETPLRMAMLKRHDPEYVDRKEIEHTHRGGVLVVPGRLTMESWRELFEKKNDPTQAIEEE